MIKRGSGGRGRGQASMLWLKEMRGSEGIIDCNRSELN